mmetsp:Transcript_2294/g.2652  ORF Transcript_2294/g.2652 Transcript_2294/m.2652 type:complete len:146 (-) Transcript_2294:71-508(-)
MPLKSSSSCRANSSQHKEVANNVLAPLKPLDRNTSVAFVTKSRLVIAPGNFVWTNSSKIGSVSAALAKVCSNRIANSSFVSPTTIFKEVDVRAVMEEGAKEEKAVTTTDDGDEDENARRATAQAEEENCMMAWLFLLGLGEKATG